MADTATADIDTLVFGVDALSHDILSRLPSGTAPTIESLVDDGVSGPLESQLPPWTPSTWPTIYTGVNPGKHGIYGFLRFEGYDWDVVNATDIHEYTLWELLSLQGRSSVVVNAPVTHPPPTFDGALIPGYIAPEDPDCHPAGLLEEVREAIGEYRLYNRQLSEGASKDERIDGYEEVVGMRGRAFRYLLDREEGVTYLKSKVVARELDLSAKEVGINMAALQDRVTGIEIEQWARSSSTTGKVVV